MKNTTRADHTLGHLMRGVGSILFDAHKMIGSRMYTCKVVTPLYLFDLSSKFMMNGSDKFAWLTCYINCFFSI